MNGPNQALPNVAMPNSMPSDIGSKPTKIPILELIRRGGMLFVVSAILLFSVALPIFSLKLPIILAPVLVLIITPWMMWKYLRPKYDISETKGILKRLLMFWITVFAIILVTFFLSGNVELRILIVIVGVPIAFHLIQLALTLLVGEKMMN